MHPPRPKAANVDEYIAMFPKATQAKLKQVRKAIRSVAPDAEEVISYAIPAYKDHGILVYFSGYEHHLSVYPGHAVNSPKLAEQLKPYLSGRSTLRFPLDQPLPLDLIKKFVANRLEQNLNK